MGVEGASFKLVMKHRRTIVSQAKHGKCQLSSLYIIIGGNSRQISAFLPILFSHKEKGKKENRSRNGWGLSFYYITQQELSVWDIRDVLPQKLISNILRFIVFISIASLHIKHANKMAAVSMKLNYLMYHLSGRIVSRLCFEVLTRHFCFNFRNPTEKFY
jgi:hypothetical protein